MWRRVRDPKNSFLEAFLSQAEWMGITPLPKSKGEAVHSLIPLHLSPLHAPHPF